MDAATFIWMFFVLKLPIVAACLVIWWAVREPAPARDTDDSDEGGSKRPRHPRPRGPGPPRRGGPHARPMPGPPTRVRGRAATARSTGPRRVR